MWIATTAEKKIQAAIDEGYTNIVVQGGQGASKSMSIEKILWKRATERRIITTIATDTYTNLLDGAIKDYRDLYRWGGLDFKTAYHGGEKDLKVNNSKIQMRYVLQKEEAGKSKRRSDLYVNEATKIPWKMIEPYISRSSGVKIYDYNPDRPCWCNTEIPLLDGYKKIILTYKDNECISQAEKAFIEARKGTPWYRIFGEGLEGTYSDRIIYPYEVIAEVPKDAEFIGYGMDFGYDPDRTALMAVYIRGAEIYIHEVFSENHLNPRTIPGAQEKSIRDRMDEIQISKTATIIADSSGRQEILDLIKGGYNIRGCGRKNDPMSHVRNLQSFKMFITDSSVQTMEGCNSFFKKEDKLGNILQEMDGHEPDEMAAVRYRMMDYLRTHGKNISSSVIAINPKK